MVRKDKSSSIPSSIDTGALHDVFGTVLDDGHLKTGVKVSRRESKAIQKELKQKERVLDAELKKSGGSRAKSIRRELKERDRELTQKTAVKRKARRNAKDVVSYIGYDLMFRDGLCQVEDGLYSETMEFADMSYQSANKTSQETVLSQMMGLYDYFGADALVQFTIVNEPIPREQVGHRAFYDVGAQTIPSAARYAEIYNNILNEKMKEGVSNMTRRRFVTYSVGADNVDIAIPQLARTRADLEGVLANMGSPAHKLNGTERLKLVHSILCPGHPFLFDYSRDISPAFPQTTKDAIAPYALNFKPHGDSASYRSDDMYCQVLCMGKFGSELSDAALADIVDLPIPLCVTWYAQGTDKSWAINYLKRRDGFVDKDIITEQRTAAKQGYSGNILPAELKYSKSELQTFMDQIQNNNQRFFWFTGLVWTYAKTPDELTENVLRIISTARRNSIDIQDLAFRQREGLNSVLPLGHNHVEVQRPFTTAQVAMFVPFATTEIDDGAGSQYVGQNQLSRNLVMPNRIANRSQVSPMGLIVGKSGSGKSFAAKNEISNTILLRPDDQIFILDRAGEYAPCTEAYGGRVINIEPGTGTIINPFNTSTTGLSGLSDTELSYKSEVMISALSSEGVLDEADKSVITSAVNKCFAAAAAETRVPTLRDFYNALLQEDLSQTSKEHADRLALRCRRFIEKPYDFFCGQSNIDLSARITDINFLGMPDSVTAFGYVTVMELIRNIMYENSAKGRRTWLYIEEIKSVMEYSAVLSYFSRFANEGRKFSLVLTGITQFFVDIFSNEKARDMAKNADYVLLLQQSGSANNLDPAIKTDLSLAADIWGLSRTECAYIQAGVKPGSGLLISGSRHVPVDCTIPTDNALYELFQTDPSASQTGKVISERKVA